MKPSLVMQDVSDRRATLSALWTFVLFNYLYADVVMVIVHPQLYQKAAGQMSAAILLGATALMEVLIAMVLLSRVLPMRANRWSNIAAGIIGTLFVGMTLISPMPAWYVFLASLEIATTLFIIWFAWTWRTHAHPALAAT